MASLIGSGRPRAGRRRLAAVTRLSLAAIVAASAVFGAVGTVAAASQSKDLAQTFTGGAATNLSMEGFAPCDECVPDWLFPNTPGAIALGVSVKAAITHEEAKPPAVAIQSLGGFWVVRDGEPVGSTEWQSKKARDLLKILVSRRGRPTPRETLIELLWPDEDRGPLANRLSVELTTVRTVLDPKKRYPSERFVLAEKATIALDLATIDVDVERFLADCEVAGRLGRAGRTDEARARMHAAEEAYGGDFLEEDAYEDWAVPLREEARAAYVTIARTLAEEAMAAGQLDQAARFYLRILERDAYDEPAHLGLVASLVEAGRHGEARRRYGLHASRMDELGIEAAAFPVVARAAEPA